MQIQQRKKALLNVTTEIENDIACFKWATIGALHYTGTENECTTEELKKYEDKIDFEMMEFPVDVYCDAHTKNSLFRQFENTNNVSVNIFSANIGNFSEYRNCEEEENDRIEEEKDDGRWSDEDDDNKEDKKKKEKEKELKNKDKWACNDNGKHGKRKQNKAITRKPKKEKSTFFKRLFRVFYLCL